MYVFQFMDATYRIDRQTNSKVSFVSILHNQKAFALYEGVYDTRAEADAAMKEIGALLAA
jgi:hypothetical protein